LRYSGTTVLVVSVVENGWHGWLQGVAMVCIDATSIPTDPVPTSHSSYRIFIIEGIITVAVAIASWWLIVPFPEESTFLEPEEKELMLSRVKADSGHDANEAPITPKLVLHHLKDWKVWAAVAMNMGVTENANSIANFQPTILKGIGYTSSSAQVHTIPVYITGAVFSVTLAFVSRYFNHHYGF